MVGSEDLHPFCLLASYSNGNGHVKLWRLLAGAASTFRRRDRRFTLDERLAWPPPALHN